MTTLYVVFGKDKQVVCDHCCDVAGFTFHQRRVLTHDDVASSIDLNDAMEQIEMSLPPVCSYCGDEVRLEDLPDGA